MRNDETLLEQYGTFHLHSLAIQGMYHYALGTGPA